LSQSPESENKKAELEMTLPSCSIAKQADINYFFCKSSVISARTIYLLVGVIRTLKAARFQREKGFIFSENLQTKERQPHSNGMAQSLNLTPKEICFFIVINSAIFLALKPFFPP
jgi:hypothetical protein